MILTLCFNIFQVVEVDKDTCDDAFAYVSDLAANGIVVYSLKQDDSWRVTHHYFHFDPLAGSYDIGGLKFQWSDGVFAMALTKPKENGWVQVFVLLFSLFKHVYRYLLFIKLKKLLILLASLENYRSYIKLLREFILIS